MKTSLFLFLSFLFASCSGPQGQSSQSGSWYTVKRVSDGDTFWVDDGSQSGLKVRMIGIDAPESHQTQYEEVQYFGKEAAAYLTGLIRGKKVRLEYDVERKDRYGRTLAYVYLEDGTFVNAEMIKNGYANLMTVPPNVKYVERFTKLQSEARKNRKGLWDQEINTRK